MSFRSKILIGSLCALSTLTSCSDSDSGGDAFVTQPTASHAATLGIDWFDLLYANIRASSLSPVVASRAIAYSGVTFYEAVVPGMPEHNSLAGQLNGLDSLPALAEGGHHWPTVANVALAEIQRNLFASAPAAVLTAIDDLETLWRSQLSPALPQEVLDRSTARGLAVAGAVWAWALNDGFSTWNNCTYTVPTGPGFWVPTPPGFAAPLQPCWGKLRPFVLLYGAECAALPPTPYSLVAGSKFYLEAVEVQSTVVNLTAAQIEIAQFWADNPTQSGTPPGHWISIVSQCAAQQGLALDVAAEAYCRVGLAVADAFISCWDMKYFYNLLRPITYIQDPAGLNDPTWNTAPGIGGGNITTPPFPEHTSGHSVQSGAASEVLTDLLGNLAFDDDTHAALGLPARSFTSFYQAADEAAISRLYGGIHFRPAIERGIEQGRCIGNLVNTQVQFRK